VWVDDKLIVEDDIYDVVKSDQPDMMPLVRYNAILKIIVK